MNDKSKQPDNHPDRYLSTVPGASAVTVCVPTLEFHLLPREEQDKFWGELGRQWAWYHRDN
jgi:diadenosine tetraphosphate (Ap4A) HIT family hydrolase